jgi:hypothetical protein
MGTAGLAGVSRWSARVRLMGFGSKAYERKEDPKGFSDREIGEKL